MERVRVSTGDSGVALGVSSGVPEGVSCEVSGVAAGGVAGVPLSSIRRADAWDWINRSRSAATASATAARRSASARRERSSSNSEGAVRGVSTGGVVAGVTAGGDGVSGGVVPDRYPRDTRAGIGMLHPAVETVAPAVTRADLRRRSVETETPQARAASARPIVGAGVSVMDPTVAARGGVLPAPVRTARPLKGISPTRANVWGILKAFYNFIEESSGTANESLAQRGEGNPAEPTPPRRSPRRPPR